MSHLLTLDIETIREEYRQEAKFSRYFLDEAAEGQALLYDKWHQRHVDLMADQEATSRELSELKSTLDGEIRALAAEGDPTILANKFGIYKVTESAVANAIDINENVKTLQKKLAKIKYYTNSVRGIIDSLQQRKSMIKELGELAVMSYFGDIDYIRQQRKQSGQNKEIEKEIASKTKVPDLPSKEEQPVRRRRVLSD